MRMLIAAVARFEAVAEARSMVFTDPLTVLSAVIRVRWSVVRGHIAVHTVAWIISRRSVVVVTAKASEIHCENKKKILICHKIRKNLNLPQNKKKS